MKCKEIVGNKLLIDYSFFFFFFCLLESCYCLFWGFFLTHIQGILFEFDLEEYPVLSFALSSEYFQEFNSISL